MVGVSEESWEDAGRKAVETAASSLRDLRVAEVTKMDMKVDNGKVTAFRTRVALSFKYDGSSRSGDEPARQATWFEVLGVQPTASIDEIKAAFRQRARQYHPDRVEGLGPELREIAEKRMKQLNEAYNCAVRSR